MSHADMLIMNVQEEQGNPSSQTRGSYPHSAHQFPLLSFLTPHSMFTQMGKVESWGQGSCHEAF